MRNANRTIALIIAAAALGACNKSATDQNVAMANSAVPADIEALPADESSTTPSNELATGEDAPDTNDLNDSGNAY